MPIVRTEDGTELYVKDWGEGPAVVLIHGWPLNADSWEHQALGLAEGGCRVISYDRRGFGRSGQPFSGYDYDTMADDLAQVMDALGVKDATIAGFSMGGGEVARYMSRHGGRRVRKAALISSIAPFLMKSDDNPEGVPQEELKKIEQALRKDRAGFLHGFFDDFYGEGTPGGGVSEAMRHWSWLMAMQGSPKATIDCAKAFGTTDLRPDMSEFGVPTLIVHGSADKTVPIDATGRAAAKAIRNSELKEYDGAPHGLIATHAERLTKDLLAFVKG
ncbi:alpha/beta fold hydrolase [Brevirhabdus sp.]|uniref:alpha/beta fold hydrolase n=1 Tax=Brevirhabdus sp. TaxID=2004514 RepID=UPI004059D48E